MKPRGSFVASLVFVVLGALALLGTRGMSPLGSVFPRAIASAMILFALADIVWRWLGGREEEPAEGSSLRRAMLAVIMLGWALLLERVGFVATSLAACLLLLLVANHEPWTGRRATGYVLSTLAVVTGLYALFAYGLEVPLP